MTDAPPLTHAESRLIDDIAAQRDAVESLPRRDAAEAASVEQEVGVLDALEHLARHRGLTLAGRVEAEKIVAASRDWVAEMTGKEHEEPGRGR